jgi:hypothetical protein
MSFELSASFSFNFEQAYMPPITPASPKPAVSLAGRWSVGIPNITVQFTLAFLFLPDDHVFPGEERLVSIAPYAPKSALQPKDSVES